MLYGIHSLIAKAHQTEPLRWHVLSKTSYSGHTLRGHQNQQSRVSTANVGRAIARKAVVENAEAKNVIESCYLYQQIQTGQQLEYVGKEYQRY